MECSKKILVLYTPISEKFRSPDLGATSGSQILLLNREFLS